MERRKFWQIIEKAAEKGIDERGLRQVLEKLELSEVVSFQEHFDALVDMAYRWDLWAAAYLMGGGCGDDGFIDFRYGLIACGEEVYEKAVNAPDALAKLIEDEEIDEDLKYEEYGYVASDVYEAMTDERIPRLRRSGPTEPEGQDWGFEDSEEMSRRFPKLWALYGEALGEVDAASIEAVVALPQIDYEGVLQEISEDLEKARNESPRQRSRHDIDVSWGVVVDAIFDQIPEFEDSSEGIACTSPNPDKQGVSVSLAENIVSVVVGELFRADLDVDEQDPRFETEDGGYDELLGLGLMSFLRKLFADQVCILSHYRNGKLLKRWPAQTNDVESSAEKAFATPTGFFGRFRKRGSEDRVTVWSWTGSKDREVLPTA